MRIYMHFEELMLLLSVLYVCIFAYFWNFILKIFLYLIQTLICFDLIGAPGLQQRHRRFVHGFLFQYAQFIDIFKEIMCGHKRYRFEIFLLLLHVTLHLGTTILEPCDDLCIKWKKKNTKYEILLICLWDWFSYRKTSLIYS